ALVPMLLFSAFLALEKKRLAIYVLFLLLAMACKEDVAVWLFCFALFIGFVKRSVRLGGLTAALAVIWFVGLATPVMHSAKADSNDPMIRHVHRYDHLLPKDVERPSSTVGKAVSILLNPGPAIR